MTFKTITVWDYVQLPEDLAPMKVKYQEMIDRGIPVELVVTVSNEGELPIIKERVFPTMVAAQEWKSFLESQPKPPVSCLIVEE